MNRLPKQVYELMPWPGDGKGPFTKPWYEDIAELKRIPLYDRPPQYAEFYELQTYLDLISPIKPGVMLDAGAGCGSLSYLFHYLGWQVIACDANPGAFRLCGCQFQTIDLNKKLPFNDSTFDFVVCKQVIEHLENPYYVLSEFSRVLKRNGGIVLSVPNIVSLFSRLKFLRSGKLSYYEGYWQDHRTILHYEQLATILKECGFKEIEFHTNRYEMYNMNPRVNGARMRFLVPLLKFIAQRNAPECTIFGQLIIIFAKK